MKRKGKNFKKPTKPKSSCLYRTQQMSLFLKQKVSISAQKSCLPYCHHFSGNHGIHYLTEVSSVYFNTLCGKIKYSTEITRSKKQLLYCFLQLFHCKIQLQGSNWQGQNYVAIRAWQQKQTRTENGFDTSGNKQVIITAAWKGHNQPNWHHPSHIIKCEIPLRAV